MRPKTPSRSLQQLAEYRLNRVTALLLIGLGTVGLLAPLTLLAEQAVTAQHAPELAGLPVFSWVGGGLGLASLVGGAIMWGRAQKSIEVLETGLQEMKAELSAFRADVTGVIADSETRTTKAIEVQGVHLRELLTLSRTSHSSSEGHH